ncbi:MAG: sensor histidine kinase [Balneolaceae bacterium]|nr:sensor histidine kinase [Balneolaceae bacterium]
MIFCFQWSVFSQSSRPASPANQPPPQLTEQQFRQMVNQTSDPDSVLDLYVQFSNVMVRRNPAMVLDLIQEIEIKSDISELNKNAYVNFLKATYWNRSDLDSAAYFYGLAEQQFKALDKHFRAIDAMQQRARIKSRNNEYIEAESIYYTLLEYLDDQQFDDRIQQSVYNELTDLYIRVGAIEIALERYNQMLELGPKTPDSECNLRLKISNAYKRNLELDKATEELEKCIGKDNVRNDLMASIYRSLADLEKIGGDQQQRLLYSLEASELVSPNSGVYYGTQLFLAESFFENGMYEKTDSVIAILDAFNPRRVQLPARISFLILKAKQNIQSKDYENALKITDEGLALGKRIPQAILNVELQRLKAEALRLKGDYEEAYSILSSLADHERMIEKTGRIQMEEMGRVRYQMKAKNLELEAVNAQLSLVRFRTFTIIFLIIALGGFLVYRYRVIAELKEERTRTKIANDLHDEVSATLTGITYFAEAVKQDLESEKKSHFINLIAESAGDAKEKITDIVWSITPENDNWELLLAKCRRYASDLLESKGINYVLDIDKAIDGKLDMNMRQHIWMIYKELITNAVRHAQSSTVKVTIKQQGNSLYLSVSDDGIGFDIENKSGGNGLTNIKRRADKLKASFSLQSSVGKGTSCNLNIPLN